MITRLDIFKKKLVFEKVYTNHILANHIFEHINENVQTSEKTEVLELLESADLTATPQEFLDSINKSKHKEMLSDYSIDELSKMDLYKVPGYNIGYALKNDGDGVDIVSVHNNEPSIKGIGKDLIKSAINNGGNKLDHFDIEPLSTIYSDMGFVEVERYPYDPQYDEDGSFARKYGELDVVYRKLK